MKSFLPSPILKSTSPDSIFIWTLLRAYLLQQWAQLTWPNWRSTSCPTGIFTWKLNNRTVLYETSLTGLATFPIVSTSPIFQHLCSGFSLEALHGFMFGVDAAKSLILTLACIERVITVEEAVRSEKASRMLLTDIILGEISSAGASIPNRPLGKCRVGSWHWRVWHDCEACSCHPLCSAIIKSNKHKGKTNSNVKDISMTLRNLTWLQDFVQLPLIQTSTRAKQIQRWCAVEIFGWLQELIYLWSHLDPYVAARISDVIKWCDKTSYLDLFRLKSCSRQDLKSVLKQIVTVRKQLMI